MPQAINITGTLYRHPTNPLHHWVYGDNHRKYSLTGEYSEKLGLHLLDLARIDHFPHAFYGARVQIECPDTLMSNCSYGWIKSLEPLAKGISRETFNEFTASNEHTVLNSLADLSLAIHRHSFDFRAKDEGVTPYQNRTEAVEAILKVGPRQKYETSTNYFHRLQRWQKGLTWSQFREENANPNWQFHPGDRVTLFKKKKPVVTCLGHMIGIAEIYVPDQIAISGVGYFDRITGINKDPSQKGSWIAKYSCPPESKDSLCRLHNGSLPASTRKKSKTAKSLKCLN